MSDEKTPYPVQPAPFELPIPQPNQNDIPSSVSYKPFQEPVIMITQPLGNSPQHMSR